MCCKNYWKRIVPFAIALVFGVFVADAFQKFTAENENNFIPTKVSRKKDYTGHEIGSGGGFETDTVSVSRAGTNSLKIISKPRPSYTDAARQNQVSGVVRLRATFLASGQIGSVTPVSGLPDGLTEQAMTAAQNIKFEPATKDGEAVTVTKIIEYSFSIY